MSQRIIDGIDKVGRLFEGKRIFLVRGNITKYPVLNDFFNRYEHIDFADITPNPLYEQVVAGVDKFNESGCDIIAAVGGGSVIDTAKCIKLFCRMGRSQNYLKQDWKDSGIPLIAIPTTAGTGSESTRHAVIYYGGEKQSISHDSIIPDVAILEPSTLKTLPVYQKKCTMLDALCQAIESFWSIASEPESKRYSELAIKLIRDNYKKYIEDNDEIASANIMKAANYSGRAINITATTAPHAMSYKLSSLYNLPHGHAVALCMKEVWRYTLTNTKKCVDPRGHKYLEKTISDIPVTYDWFVDFMDWLEMDNPISNNKEADIKVLADSVNKTRLKNNPIKLDYDTLKAMYEVIVK